MFAIIRTAITGLRRDVGALALSFVLPVAFFTIFAIVFGGMHDTVPRVKLIAVDEDRSEASQSFVRGLEREGSLIVTTRPAAGKNGALQPEYSAQSAEAAVKTGAAPVAIVIPAGWGANPISFAGGAAQHPIRMISDSSDPIAPQMVSGLLQEVAMTSMPSAMAEQGGAYTERFLGGFTPAQRKQWDANMAALKQIETRKADAATSATAGGEPQAGIGGRGVIAVTNNSVAGKSDNKSMISFYAAAIGVMFLLFTASGASGAILEESENGTLDRVLSSRVTMTSLLSGKLTYNILLAFTQLVIMYVFAWAVFHVDLWGHIPGFLVMSFSTAFAVAAFAILLASICKTRGQLAGLSTLLILIMSSVGGSMIPRYFMSQAMQNAGLFTINAWAIDGFTKVFWRDMPVSALWPQVSVLVGAGIVFFVAARRIARKWEFA
jgi:ABC-2 type transport system permease protein